MNLVHKIWGEQAPTYLGVERPKLVVEHLAPGLYWWTKVTYPVIIAGDSLAKGTLRIFGVEITRSWTKDEAEDGEGPIEGRFAARQQMLELLGRIEGLPHDRRDEILAALDIGDIGVPPMTLEAGTSIAAAIDRFQEAHQELALATDDGRVVGLLTSTDAFEAIAGQLEDPLD